MASGASTGAPRRTGRSSGRREAERVSGERPATDFQIRTVAAVLQMTAQRLSVRASQYSVSRLSAGSARRSRSMHQRSRLSTARGRGYLARIPLRSPSEGPRGETPDLARSMSRIVENAVRQPTPIDPIRKARLSLTPPMRAGEVRQRLAHGRSKAVTVEVKRRRSPSVAPRAAESAGDHGSKQGTAFLARPNTAPPAGR